MSTSRTDAAGVTHPCAGDDARIVCLVPSITELICDLGLASQLVGRTGFCIHPRSVVGSIRKVGGTKDVKLDVVRELAPTHVVVNVDENRRDVVDAAPTFVPHVIVTHPLGPEDNPGLYRLIGGVFGREAEAEQLCGAFEQALAEARAVSAARPARQVLYLVWRDPWMTVSRDTYISRMLAVFGWRTVPAASGERYPVVDLAAVVPGVDRVLLSSEPYRFRAKHLAEVEALVGGTPVSLIDGEMTSWYGSRAVRGLEYLTAYTV